jgi:hypothetical protein
VTRLLRLRALCLSALAALALAGCGAEDPEATVANTEGLYLEVDELKYQVQISRILNPADVEDQAYLRGVSEGVAPAADEVWFGVFMRVQNETDHTLRPADAYELIDTTERRFPALNLDPESNLFAYKPTPIPAGGLLPVPGSIPASGTIQGSLVLFKVKVESLSNRPLELHIRHSTGRGGEGIIDIDV